MPNAPQVESIPLNSGKFADRPKPLPGRCVILETAGHSWSMNLFPMPKYLADNRFVAAMFVALTFVNAFAIQNNWY